MPDDLRNARRARLSGVRVTLEGATGERQQADVTDMSKEGLFIAVASPLAVGKRLSLEIEIVGEPAPWPALGRVVWVRATGENEDRPAGMGVKIIDIDDAGAAVLDRLLETRERTEPGLGEGTGEAERTEPGRERTMLGVGDSNAPPAPPVPIVVAAPEREATLLGVGTSQPEDAEPVREPSIAIDLVAKRPSSAAPAKPPPSPREAVAHEELEETVAIPRRRAKRSGGGGVLLFVLFVAVCAGAGYALRDRLLVFWRAETGEITNAPKPAPSPPPSPTLEPPPSHPTTAATPSTPAATPSLSASVRSQATMPSGSAASLPVASSTASSAPSSGPASASAKRPAPALPVAPAPHKAKPAEETNPY